MRPGGISSAVTFSSSVKLTLMLNAVHRGDDIECEESGWWQSTEGKWITSSNFFLGFRIRYIHAVVWSDLRLGLKGNFEVTFNEAFWPLSSIYTNNFSQRNIPEYVAEQNIIWEKPSLRQSNWFVLIILEQIYFSFVRNRAFGSQIKRKNITQQF